MKRAWLLTLAFAGCGEEKKKDEPTPFPAENSVTVEAVRAAGFENAARVRFANLELGEVSYIIERVEKEETTYHTIGRVRMRPGYDAAEALERHRRDRDELAREAESDAPGSRRLRDRPSPAGEAYLYTEDSTATQDVLERRRLATIGFACENYVVVVTANGGAADTIEDLTRRAGKLSRWIETQFAQCPRPPR